LSISTARFFSFIFEIFSKKAVADLVEENKDMVKISKSEYAMLLDKAKKYDEIVNRNNQTNE
jgi:hypothetical protein